MKYNALDFMLYNFYNFPDYTSRQTINRTMNSFTTISLGYQLMFRTKYDITEKIQVIKEKLSTLKSRIGLIDKLINEIS